MVNALYNFDIAPYTGMSWMYPYIGVGAGYAWTNSNDTLLRHQLPVLLKRERYGRQLCLSGHRGASFPIDPCSWAVSITAEYRFFGVIGNNKYHGAVDTGLTPATYAAPSTRPRSGRSTTTPSWPASATPSTSRPPPPPPAPVVAPAPAPARSYLVFFDWDRADLTDRAPPDHPRGGRELDPGAVHAASR